MSDPLTFENASPRFALPFLYSGQAQKEFYVNEAFAIADAVLHCAIEGTSTTAPATPVDGENWCIATGATGDWAGHVGKIACRQSADWLYVTPKDGMRVFDRSTGRSWLYFAGWKIPSAISAPTGGSTVDSEARSAVTQLINALKVAGILP
jgi:hypothetical protein